MKNKQITIKEIITRNNWKIPYIDIYFIFRNRLYMTYCEQSQKEYILNKINSCKSVKDCLQIGVKK